MIDHLGTQGLFHKFKTPKTNADVDYFCACIYGRQTDNINSSNTHFLDAFNEYLNSCWANFKGEKKVWSLRWRRTNASRALSSDSKARTHGLLGRGGGIVVSILANCCDDPVRIPLAAKFFSNCTVRKDENKMKKRLGMAHLKKDSWAQRLRGSKACN